MVLPAAILLVQLLLCCYRYIIFFFATYFLVVIRIVFGKWKVSYTENVHLTQMTSLAGDFWVISLYSSISIILQIECICIVCQMYENSKKNRFVIATQDIRAGELLLSEAPVVCGPYWDTKISCLNCYAPPGPMCK